VSGFIDELIEEYAPDNDIVVVEIMRKPPKAPLVAKFRIVTDQAETNTLKRRAGDWITEQNTLASKGIQAGKLKQYWVNDPELLGQVFVLADLAIDPDQQNKGDWLELARKNGPVFSGVFATVDAASLKNRSQLMETKVSQEKKDLQTPSIEPE
jgi:hypothetical protein